MFKTKVLIITPGTVSNRLSEDLDIKYTVRPENLGNFKPYIDAFEHYEFYYASYISVSEDKMLEFADEIMRDWPDISCAVYLDPDTMEGGFYHESCLGMIGEGKVGVEGLVEELCKHGVSAIPMKMDFDDSIFERGEISIRAYYEDALSVISSIPRIT